MILSIQTDFGKKIHLAQDTTTSTSDESAEKLIYLLRPSIANASFP